MDAKKSYETCLMQVTDIVTQVQPEHLDNKTPDDDWNVRDLLNHIMYEVVWVPDMIAGHTVSEVGDKYDGDLVGDDLQKSWADAAQRTRDAVQEADVNAPAHLSYTDTTVGDYLNMTGGDILIHAWDLAKGIGVDIVFNEQMAEQIWQGVKDQDLASSGLFKPPLEVPDDAPLQTRILAKFGRDANWQP